MADDFRRRFQTGFGYGLKGHAIMVVYLVLFFATGVCGMPVAGSFDCGDDGTFHADPLSCSKYYRCVHGNAVLMNCPAGLVFNLERNVCDWPRNVECENGIRPTSTTTTTTPTSITTPTTTTVDTGSFHCPDGPNGAFYADPLSCSRYYRCVHGNSVLMNCPAGLVFNLERNVCDWPGNVECENGITPTSTTTTTPTTTTTSTTTTPTTTSTNTTDDFFLLGFHLKTSVDVPDESDLDSVLASVRSRLYSHLSIYYTDLQSQSLQVCKGANSDKLTVGAELKLPVSAFGLPVARITVGILSLTGETWKMSGEYMSFTVSVGSLTVVADTTAQDVFKAFMTCTGMDCDVNDTGVCD